MPAKVVPDACLTASLVVFDAQAEEHDARQLEDIRQSEPEFYAMVTAVLQRARNELA